MAESERASEKNHTGGDAIEIVQQSPHDNKAMTKTAFMGGSLAFKGEKKKSTKKSTKSKHKLEKEKLKDDTPKLGDEEEEVEDEDMTEAERRALRRRLEQQRKDNEKIAKKSHRERVEELNEHLGSLTELNDIPRVSAAGNG